jgi:hypothetical protein
MKMKTPAVRTPNGNVDVSGYGITGSDIGRWTVIQWGSAALSIEDTREQAIVEAQAACGGDDLELSEYPSDGACTVDEVVEL